MEIKSISMQKNVFANAIIAASLLMPLRIFGQVLPAFTSGSTIEIKKDINLRGKTIQIPEDVTLKFNGGIIKNGVLIGNGTKIEYKNVAFDKVCIKGTWKIPLIRTSMFKDLEEVNALKNVFALSNENYKNKIIIEEGKYLLSANRNGESILNINNDTEVIIEGTIILLPNDYGSSNIVHVTGHDIILTGKGSIIGDRVTHYGRNGEWGMGVMVTGSSVKIEGLNIQDCWGDCIYVGGHSSRVTISNCKLVGGRRQGISITSAVKVRIEACTISNVGGTDPEYAIDIEPNKGCVVRDIVIDKLKTNNCRGGVGIYGRAEGAEVENVIVCRSNISGDTKTAISFIQCSNVTLEKCIIMQNGGRRVVDCQDVNSIIVRNNKMVHYQSKMEQMEDKARELVGRETSSFVRLYNCSQPVISPNNERRIVK